jgi:hypothetical protein
MTKNLPAGIHAHRRIYRDLEAIDAHAEARTATFSIVLGTQLRATHTVHIVQSTLADQCYNDPAEPIEIAAPARLQTALALYAHKPLHGLVLLVDSARPYTVGDGAGLEQKSSALLLGAISQLYRARTDHESADRFSL